MPGISLHGSLMMGLVPGIIEQQLCHISTYWFWESISTLTLLGIICWIGHGWFITRSWLPVCRPTKTARGTKYKSTFLIGVLPRKIYSRVTHRSWGWICGGQSLTHSLRAMNIGGVCYKLKTFLACFNILMVVLLTPTSESFICRYLFAAVSQCITCW